MISSDINPQRAGIQRLDFLTAEPPPATRGTALITNPPFAYLDEFMQRALQLLDAGWLKGVVLLMRADAANTQSRIDVLNRAAYELVVTARSQWLPNTKESPRWWFQWVVWLSGDGGPPTCYRVNRGDLAGG